MPGQSDGCVAAVMGAVAVSDALAIARLEQAVTQLEQLLSRQDSEMRRLRRVEAAARDALAAMDLCLDDMTTVHADRRPVGALPTAQAAVA